MINGDRNESGRETRLRISFVGSRDAAADAYDCTTGRERKENLQSVETNASLAVTRQVNRQTFNSRLQYQRRLVSETG